MNFRKYLTGLLWVCLPLLAAGYLLSRFIPVPFLFTDLLLLTVSFSAIGITAALISRSGLKKGAEGGTMYLMVALSVKLLLEMVLALLWFVVVKKTYLSSVILFLVLYLAVSLFSIIFILNTLKTKPL